MGSRANYVVVEGGQWDLFYAHWGAQRIPEDFFPGPDVAARFIRGLKPTDEWLDDVWAEGAALMDVDKKFLTLFGGEDILCEYPLRRMYLELLACTWPGWTVTWAVEGLVTIAEYLGLDPGLVQAEPSADRLAPLDAQVIGKDTKNPFADSIITVRSDDGLRNYLVGSLGRFLTCGQDIVDLLRGRTSSGGPFREGDISSTVYVDGVNRKLWLTDLDRFSVRDRRWQDWLEPVWPGWEIDFHDDHLAGHLTLSGQEGLMNPADEDDLLSRLGGILVREPTFDPSSVHEALVEGLGDVEKIEVNPNFFQKLPSELTGPERKQIFFKALEAYRQKRRGLGIPWPVVCRSL
jgi:hypothetical protein